MGNALVIVDSFGRTMVYVQGYALNQMLPARSNQTAHDDELHALIGLYWFPVFPQQQKASTACTSWTSLSKPNITVVRYILVSALGRRRF